MDSLGGGVGAGDSDDVGSHEGLDVVSLVEGESVGAADGGAGIEAVVDDTGPGAADDGAGLRAFVINVGLSEASVVGGCIA